jgi:hypothetical protein
LKEYSEELKAIAKGSRKNKDSSDNGVTMTSIRHKSSNEGTPVDARSINTSAQDVSGHK